MNASPHWEHEGWFVVQTKPRQEWRAFQNMLRQGFRCHLPVVRVEKILRRTRRWVEEPLFARYVFVHVVDAGARWHVIRSTRGVARVVRFGGAPARVPERWMDEFLASERAPVKLYEPGQRVCVTTGAFAGLEGIFELPDGESRATILIEMLGKLSPASFPMEALRKAA